MTRFLLFLLALALSISSYSQDTIPTTGTLKIGKKDTVFPEFSEGGKRYRLSGVKGRRFGYSRIRLSTSGTTSGFKNSYGSVSMRLGSYVGIIYDVQLSGIEGKWHMVGAYAHATPDFASFSHRIKTVFEINDSYGVYSIDRKRGNHESYNKLGLAAGFGFGFEFRTQFELLVEYQLQRSNNLKQNGFALTLRAYLF